MAIPRTRSRPSLQCLKRQAGRDLEFADGAPHFPAQNTTRITINSESNFTPLNAHLHSPPAPEGLSPLPQPERNNSALSNSYQNHY